MVVNDFVFVAGNQALRENGELGAGVAVPPTRNWGGQNGFRRQVHYVIKERLEPSLKAAGSTLEQSLKAQVYIRGVNNFPDFIDVWSQYFRDIPCAVTLVPAKDYSSIESMLEINLIALRTGATRRKQVVDVDIPALASYGPCVRAGELVFPSGLMALGATAACRPRTTPPRSTRSASRARPRARWSSPMRKRSARPSASRSVTSCARNTS